MARLFISYRRSDTGAYADRLENRLAQFQFESVFLDRDDIGLAQNYADTIRTELARSEAVLVLIGPTWATVADASGSPRLNDPADWVRREVALALSLGKPVVPLLLDGGRLPPVAALPPELRPLATAQGYEVTGDHFDRDVTDFASRLERQLVSRDRAARDTGPAADETTPLSVSLVRQLQMIWIGLGVITFAMAAVGVAVPPLRYFFTFPLAMTVAVFVRWQYAVGEMLRPARARAS